MWAQRLGHKNTSRVQPPKRNWTQKSRHRPFSSSPSPPDTSFSRMCSWFRHEEKEMQACWNISGVYPSVCPLYLEDVTFYFKTSVQLEGSLKDTSRVFEHSFRKGGHVWDYWATAPQTLPTSLTILCPPPSSVSPPGYPFWPRKSPDPALRVC